MRDYAAILNKVESNLRDTGNTNFATTELDEEIVDALYEVSQFFPHERMETYTIESRTGTASSTSSGNLVDASESQFVSGDVGKMIYNSTDRTWAEIVTYTSATTVALSKDIMASGEDYDVYNNECTSKFQINISDITDYLSISKVEYPKGRKRNWTMDGTILTIMVNTVDDSKVLTSGIQPATEVYIWFKVKHKVSQLTDFAGAVNNAPGYSAGDTSMAINSIQTTGTIEADQEFTMANTRGIYRVTADATISGNAATIIFYPGLQSDVDNTDVITFTQSTLTNPMVELYVIEYATALAAIREPAQFYQQIHASLTTVAAAATATAAVAARITQAVTDIGSGRTEAAKVTTILDTANTELDKIGAELTLGVADLALGRTEAAKIPTIVDAAATAIAAVAARITQSLTDIASARTAIALGVTAITSANTQMALTDAQVDLAVTALAEGELLINTVPVAGGAGEFMGQANADVNAAQGFLRTGQGFTQQSSANFNNASADYGAAARELDAANAKIREAQANLQQANTNMGANVTNINLAVGEIRAAGGYIQEAQGYIQEGSARLNINSSYLQSSRGELAAGAAKIREAQSNLQEVSSELQIASSGRIMENWGRTELERVKAKLRRSVPNKYRTSQVYTRG